MHVIPLDGRIIVRRFDESTEQPVTHVDSGTPREAVDRGVVIAADTDRLESDGGPVRFAVKAGDIVVFGPNTGKNLVFGGEAYLIIDRKDIFGIERVGTSLPRRSDDAAASRRRESEHAMSEGASYGPHRIVVWSTLEEGRVDAAVDHDRSRQGQG